MKKIKARRKNWHKVAFCVNVQFTKRPISDDAPSLTKKKI